MFFRVLSKLFQATLHCELYLPKTLQDDWLMSITNKLKVIKIPENIFRESPEKIIKFPSVCIGSLGDHTINPYLNKFLKKKKMKHIYTLWLSHLTSC